MYQTCLAYANGAISGTTYSFIMSRLDDTIVTLLMGETAGGAFGRKLAFIGGKSNASASAVLSSLPGRITDLEDRIAATTAAEEELRKAEDNLAQHVASKPNEGQEAQHEARTAELKADVKKAEGKRNAVQRLMKDTLEATSDSAAEITRIESGGNRHVIPDPLIAATLADMQAEFLLQDVSSAIVTACVVELGRQFGTGTDRHIAAAKEAFIQTLKTTSTVKAESVKSAFAIATKVAEAAATKASEAETEETEANDILVEVIAKAEAAQATVISMIDAAKIAEAEAAKAEDRKAMALAKLKQAEASVAARPDDVESATAFRAAAVELGDAVKDATTKFKVAQNTEAHKAQAVAEANAAEARRTAAVNDVATKHAKAVTLRADADTRAKLADALAVKTADALVVDAEAVPKHGLEVVAAKRITGSQLARFCSKNLRPIIDVSNNQHAEFRKQKARLRAKTDEKKYGAHFAASSAIANKAFVEAIRACEGLKEADMQKACKSKLFEVSE